MKLADVEFVGLLGCVVPMDVSGGATGGTAIVWANGTTWMNGTINAGGALSGGSIEVSGKESLAYIDLSKFDFGAGGQLLLDPKNITIVTGGSDPVASVDQFSDIPSLSATAQAVAGSS